MSGMAAATMEIRQPTSFLSVAPSQTDKIPPDPIDTAETSRNRKLNDIKEAPLSGVKSDYDQESGQSVHSLHSDSGSVKVGKKLKSPSHFVTSALPTSEIYTQMFNPGDLQKKNEVTLRYLQVSICVAAGVVFGIAIEKSRVVEPYSIRRQMVFRQWIILKYFFGALCSSQLCLAILSLLPWSKHHFKETLFNYLCSIKGKGILSSVIGSLLLGIGMTVSGSCPGIVLVQVSAGIHNSGFTLIGVLLGTLAYSFLEPYIVKYTAPKVPYSIEPTFIHEKLNVHYAAVALPMTICLMLGLTLIEYFIPWDGDLHPQAMNIDGATIVSATSWPPSAAGAMMGVLQVPLVLAISNTLGGSSGYVTIVSQWVVTKKLQQKFKYLAAARTGFLRNLWMVVCYIGVIIGGLLSSLSSTSNGSTRGVSIKDCIIGGFLLLFGARFASGCTSGHGITGVSMLGMLSFISTCCLFGGGIITAFIMDYFNAL